MNLHEALLFGAPIVGLVAFLIGLGALLAPKHSAKMFGVEITGSGIHYLRVSGARDIFIGLILFILWRREDRTTIASACLSLVVVCVVDFLVTFLNGSRRSSILHFLGMIALIAYSSLLIYY